MVEEKENSIRLTKLDSWKQWNMHGATSMSKKYKTQWIRSTTDLMQLFATMENYEILMLMNTNNWNRLIWYRDKWIRIWIKLHNPPLKVTCEKWNKIKTTWWWNGRWICGWCIIGRHGWRSRHRRRKRTHIGIRAGCAHLRSSGGASEGNVKAIEHWIVFEERLDSFDQRFFRLKPCPPRMIQFLHIAPILLPLIAVRNPELVNTRSYKKTEWTKKQKQIKKKFQQRRETGETKDERRTSFQRFTAFWRN